MRATSECGPRLVRAVAALALLLVAAARADIYVMKDGRRIEGVLVKEERGVLTVKTGIGELQLARADIKEIIAKLTTAQEFEARWSAAKSAEDFFQVGEFAQSKKLKREATKAWNKAIEIEPDHLGARSALGYVRYKDEWLTPQQRDERIRAEEEAEMGARGLVRYQDRWVTPEDRRKLESGMELVEGVWLPFADAQRKRGLEEFEGAWLPRAIALARRDLAAVAPLAKLPLQFALTNDALIAGPFATDRLQAIGAQMDISRAWFDAAWKSPPGLALFGGRLAELYAFSKASDPFVDTIAHFASLTTTVPPGWAEAVAGSHGFFWIDPYPLSSARQWHRSESDLVGHCLHHWGHLLLGRLGYDGRLLPAWYEEGVACLSEVRGHARNAVFCRGSLLAVGGTASARGRVDFGTGRFREGGWRDFLRQAFEAKAVQGFDQLAQLEFATLELVDIAASMAIVEWLQMQKDGAGLRAFHDALRRGAPKSPERVIRDGHARQANYDRAFQAAAGMNWREADQAWRKWFLAGN